MTHGFDLNSPLVCEGIVGDGCGGGRIFFVEDTKLFVYDPLTQERMLLLDELGSVVEIKKEGCMIFLHSEAGVEQFDLSALKKV
jgi:hypothetical protein